jgi:hypothetical protein
VLHRDEGKRAALESLGDGRDHHGRAGRGSAEQEARQLPVQGEQQPDAVGAAVAVDEQVGGLADPVVDGRGGELDPRWSGVQGQEGGGRVAVADEPPGQLQMSS